MNWIFRVIDCNDSCPIRHPSQHYLPGGGGLPEALAGDLTNGSWHFHYHPSHLAAGVPQEQLFSLARESYVYIPHLHHALSGGPNGVTQHYSGADKGTMLLRCSLGPQISVMQYTTVAFARA